MSDTTAQQKNAVKKTRRNRNLGIYTTMMITQRVSIPMTNVGDNIKQTLERVIANSIEGKCIVEGYIKQGSTRVVSYSSGELHSSEAMFDVVIECMVCCPVEGMHISCFAKTITDSAGIKAEVDEDPSPVVIFVARDHHYTNKLFSKVNVGDKIKVRVIGQRYELNDKYISIIAELIEDKAEKYGKRKNNKPKLKIKQ
jgi:DNA-directed RNA polymerase subunit E'/Rpb7